MDIQSVFISDLHLTETHAESFGGFQHFMDDIATGFDHLYILGDLFEYWLGTDLMSDFQKEVFAKLQQFSNQNPQRKVYFMHGNRDLLITKQLCEQHQIILLKDPTTITLGGKKILLSHGDKLCTLDKRYQRYRMLVNLPIVKKLFLKLPKKVRRDIVENLRARSQRDNRLKPLEIMDVSERSVEKMMRKYGGEILIHGHTHKPAVHDVPELSDSSQRFVLGSWDEQVWYISNQDGEVKLMGGAYEND